MSESVQSVLLTPRVNRIAMLLPAMIPAGFWLQSLDSFAIYTDYETPPGQILYIFSKLMGLYAVFLLWLQILLGLGRKMPNGQRPGISMTLHRNLGIATFAALVLHAALFVLAVSVRKEYFVYGLLLPVFNDGFYRLAVTLGILALYGLIFTLIAGVLRKQGKKWAVWMHRISLVAFALTLVHCLLIGTETRYFTMIALYSLMVISVAIALYCRSKNPKNLPSVG